MLKLKGRMAERLSGEKRARMERTLKRMEEIRRKDDMRLRELIKAKREWVDKEREKGYNIIEQLDKQIEQIKEQQEAIKKQIIKLDGCALVLDDLIEESQKLDQQEAAEELKKVEEVVDKKTVKRGRKKKSE